MTFLLRTCLLYQMGCFAYAKDICERVCNEVETCRNEPHRHSSYCKTWQRPPVCFGLYWTDTLRSSVCFELDELECPKALPIECDGGDIDLSSTHDIVLPTETPGSPTMSSAGTTPSSSDLSFASSSESTIYVPSSTHSTSSSVSTTVLPSTTYSTSTAGIAESRLFGSYCGTYTFEDISVTTKLTFSETTLSVELTGFFSASISGVSYMLLDGTVQISPTAEYASFLMNTPYKLVPEEVSVNSHLGRIDLYVSEIVIPLTTSNC